MKKQVWWWMILGGLVSVRLGAEEPLSGRFLELHSCEVLAGGCKVSSESPQGGRYQWRIWDFAHGQFGGQKLAGLKAALLEVSEQNLADSKALPAQAVLYLPVEATTAQREALRTWLTIQQPALRTVPTQEREVALRFTQQDMTASVAAGEFIQVQTTAREPCGTSSCGEQLWYTPRSANTGFDVGLNLDSRVTEPYLQLKWTDAGRQTVFLGQFGGTVSHQLAHVH